MQAVHLPSFAAPQFQGQSKAGPHGDFILQLDYVVGELMSTLEKLGVADNTLVIFSSDNGPETTSVIHMRGDHQHDGARPWRGMKRDGWEGGHRVPFLVRWPKKIQPGQVSNQLTSLTDVMATVAAMIDAKLPSKPPKTVLICFQLGPVRRHPRFDLICSSKLSQGSERFRFVAVHGSTSTTPAREAIDTKAVRD